MITSDKVTFKGVDDHELAAVKIEPKTGAVAWAIFAHCFTCSKDSLAARRIADALAAEGIGVLRFDFTGIGDSGGAFEETGFAHNVRDLTDAARFMADQGRPIQMLIGHSLGGAAVLAAANDIDGLKAVVTLGAPGSPGHVEHLFADHSEEIERDGSALVPLGQKKVRIGRTLLHDVRNYDLESRLKNLRTPLLVMHSPIDAIVGIENAAQIFQAAKHPKSFVSLDDADHLLSRRRDAAYAAQVIAAWAARYLLVDEPAEAPPAKGVSIVEIGTGRFLNRITGPSATTYADEPGSVGGSDAGFTPYELLAAGLGACTSMTLRMYAERKGWPLERVRVQVDHAKDYRDDREGCDDRPSKIDVLTRTLVIEGDLDPDQRRRLLEIADRCPVHQTLHRENDIVTEVTEPDDR
ncbi:MAG: alpha/beta fold hydrolase [Geminicoccaceae bacterium]